MSKETYDKAKETYDKEKRDLLKLAYLRFAGSAYLLEECQRVQ